VTIIVGNLSTKLPLDRVERVTSNEFRAAVRETPKPRQVYDAGIAERKANFRLELDVRGQRVGEAIENVMRYLDDAIMLDVGTVRILHGKGTGALREDDTEVRPNRSGRDFPPPTNISSSEAPESPW
jgi:Mismatch repair ATPase (MutS family)